MPRVLELNLAEWPQPCQGNCGRLLRPPHAKAEEYPNLRTAASQRVSEPWCQVCTAKLKGRTKGGHRRDAAFVETEEARLERIRTELAAMVADRRRRGIAPEGTVLPGDEKMHMALQRRMPGERPPAQPRTRKLDETVAPGAPLGLCQRGHPFTGVDPAGRRKCEECNAIRLEQNAKRRLERDASITPHGNMTCRQGHPYTHVTGNRKYCPTCKAASRKRVAMAKAAREHARTRVS